MLSRIFGQRLFILTLLLGIVLVWCGFLISPASAQCGTPPKSSCLTCHTEVDHLSGMSEWNKVHLNQDMCVNCHGGNGSSMDKALAHVGLVAQPLSDIYTNCHSCHPSDYVKKSSEYAATLNFTLGSCATPTPVFVNKSSGGSPPGAMTMSSDMMDTAISAQPFMLIIGGLATLALFFVVLGWLASHRQES
jgi:hypothetical protein